LAPVLFAEFAVINISSSSFSENAVELKETKAEKESMLVVSDHSLLDAGTFEKNEV
jgi:endo-1,4-beta-mannosidase